MGRLIDIDKARKEYSNLMDLSMSDTTLLHTLCGVLDNAPTVEAIPKDQYEQRLKKNNELINDLEELRTMINKFAESYENRLKADMAAMLEEIDLQFDEICFYKNMGEWKTVPEIKAEYKAVIREKINALKAEAEDT